MSKIHRKLSKVVFQCNFDVLMEWFVRTQTTAGETTFSDFITHKYAIN